MTDIKDIRSLADLVEWNTTGDDTPIDPAEERRHFDALVAKYRELCEGFSGPVDGEPLPLLCPSNLPICNDWLIEMHPLELLDLLSVAVMVGADEIRQRAAAGCPLAGQRPNYRRVVRASRLS